MKDVHGFCRRHRVERRDFSFAQQLRGYTKPAHRSQDRSGVDECRALPHPSHAHRLFQNDDAGPLPVRAFHDAKLQAVGSRRFSITTIDSNRVTVQ